jgi:Relaxase/Mobilisation nuclease domain.
MSTTRLMALHTGKGRSVGAAIRDIIDYVENPEKTNQGRLVSSYQCSARIADKEFLLAKKLYIQKTGRVRGADDVIAYQLRQSFAPGEITPEEANRLGRELAMRFTKGRNAFIVCTHIDKAHVHNHIVFSAVTLNCDRKFRDFRGSGRALARINDTLCIENGYSVVETPKHSGKSYNKWLGDRAGLSHRERLCCVIDEALKQKPESFAALLDLLRKAGYEIKGNPANPSLRGGEQKRFVRMDTLGPGYSAAELIAVIAGERQHSPKKRKAKTPKQPQRKNQLLIDIQEKLTQGKGAGYANWAKRFNLKQMAQTVAYLQDNDLMDYASLTRRADAASGKYHELSDRIKTTETRMAEIAVLRTQIVNYVKTRDTYVAYRKAGYSKKFRAEHEADILLHQAAKRHFDTLGVKKLPTVKALNAEYAKLLADKKSAYGDYRQAREEWKELLTAKANIDRILGMDAPDKTIQRERPSEQR